ncbi:hypothetical protein CYLTODRAFT_360676, partial [Cylindrobasidium torrendii FP15055 ss-10]
QLLVDPERTPPPASIPDLEYVAAAVFLSQKPKASSGEGRETKVWDKAFILEDLIRMNAREEFVKYIHNVSPIPMVQPEDSEEDYAKAVFLAASQHLLFWRSQGTIFLSDFQGSGCFLTDCQIMSNPALTPGNDNANMFGDGNVAQGFDNFPKEHICNVWCSWFGLEPFGQTDID